VTTITVGEPTSIVFDDEEELLEALAELGFELELVPVELVGASVELAMLLLAVDEVTEVKRELNCEELVSRELVDWRELDEL